MAYDGFGNPRYQTYEVDVGASATSYAHFKTRTKVKVVAAHLQFKSAGSAEEQLYFVNFRNGSAVTIGTFTPATGKSAGSLPSSLPTMTTITFTTNNTLASLGDWLVTRSVGTSGEWIVTYEYKVLEGGELPV